MSITRMVVVAGAIVAAGIVAILLFSALWFRIGLGSAIVLLVVVLLFLGWRSDKKAQAEREELESI
jgi:hypothetical protein